MAPRSKFVAPDLSNATPGMLADEMGKLSIMESQIKKLRAVYKEAFYARTGIKVEDMLNGEAKVIDEGEIFTITVTRSDPQRVSTTMLKEKYPDIAEECTTATPQLTARPTLKEGVVNPVVNDLITQMKMELDLD